MASNWRSRGTLDDYLKKWNVPGIQGIDTRALTKHLRSRGAMQGCLTTEDITPEEAVARAKAAPPMAGSDFVKEVTPAAPYDWDPEDRESRAWTIVKGDGAMRQADGKRRGLREAAAGASTTSSPTISA